MSARRIPRANWNAPVWSAMVGPTGMGSPSSGPALAIISPPAPWATMSIAGRCARGPRGPKPVAEVEGDTLLAAIMGKEEGRAPVRLELDAASGVTVARLDLDHIGAEVGQQRCRGGAHLADAQIDDADAVQDSHGSTAGGLQKNPRPWRSARSSGR